MADYPDPLPRTRPSIIQLQETLYQRIKEFRDIKEESCGIRVGVLTPRETWLYDEICALLRVNT